MLAAKLYKSCTCVAIALKYSIKDYVQQNMGVSVASPMLVVKMVNVYTFIRYVHIPYVHFALFVCDAIFP